jgi:hypothetical protein
VLQEVIARLSADLPAGETAFTDELANAVRRFVNSSQPDPDKTRAMP